MSKKRIPTLSEIVFDEVKTPVNDEINNRQEIGVMPIKRETAAQSPVSMSRRNTPLPKVAMDEKKGRASTTVYLPPEVKRQLEEIWFAERHEKSQNDLFLEGLDLVFKRRGLPSIKELLKEE